MSNLSELIPAGGGQNNTDFVADGAITSGKPVILTAAGKAAQVAETARGNTIGAEQALAPFSPSGVAGGQTWAYDATNDQYLWAYGNPDAYQRGYASIVDVSSGTVVEGTRAVFYSPDAVRDLSATCIGSNKFLIIYLDDLSAYMYGIVASVSGTSITYGSQVTINAGSTMASPTGIAYSATTDASLLVYMPTGAGNEIKLLRITVSGTTITLGTAVNVSTIFSVSYLSQNGQASIVNNASSDEFFLFWRGQNSGANRPGYGGIVTMSSGGTLAGTTATKATDLLRGFAGLAYCGNDTYVVVFLGETNRYLRYCVATVSGGNVTWGTDTVYESSLQDTTQVSVAYDSSVDKVVVTQRPDGSPYNRTYSTGDLSGTTITFASLTALSPATGITSFPVLIYDPSLQNTLFIYENSSTDVVLRLWEVTGDIPNLTATNLLGIASAAILDTATGTINTWGSRNEVQTSLTIGSDYYVQSDGTITTASASPAQLIGEAITATQINIKDYTG